MSLTSVFYIWTLNETVRQWSGLFVRQAKDHAKMRIKEVKSRLKQKVRTSALLTNHCVLLAHVWILSSSSYDGDRSWSLPHKKIPQTLSWLTLTSLTDPHHPSHGVQPPSLSPRNAITPFAHVNPRIPVPTLCRSRQKTASPQWGRVSSTKTTRQLSPLPLVQSGGRDHYEPWRTRGQSLCTLDR